MHAHAHTYTHTIPIPIPTSISCLNSVSNTLSLLYFSVWSASLIFFVSIVLYLEVVFFFYCLSCLVLFFSPCLSDEANDRHSLERSLQDSLFLIVKRNRNDHSWQFPQGRLLDTESNLRECGERVGDRAVGAAVRRWVVGNGPIGHYCYAYPPAMQQQRQQYGAKVYFMRAQLIAGAVKLETRLYKDFAWISRLYMHNYILYVVCVFWSFMTDWWWLMIYVHFFCSSGLRWANISMSQQQHISRLFSLSKYLSRVLSPSSSSVDFLFRNLCHVSRNVDIL